MFQITRDRDYIVVAPDAFIASLKVAMREIPCCQFDKSNRAWRIPIFCYEQTKNVLYANEIKFYDQVEKQRMTYVSNYFINKIVTTDGLRYVDRNAIDALDSDCRALIERQRRASTLITFDEIELYEFQKTGVAAMVEWERFILADEMGLGKTIQAACAIETLFRNEKIKCALVICERNKLIDWKKEITKYFQRRVEIVHGAKREWNKSADIYVTTYDTAANDIERLIMKFQCVVFDEITRIKNIQTRNAKMLRKLDDARYMFGLSGMPIENALQEAYNIFDFINPGCLGNVYAFRQRYIVFDHFGGVKKYININEFHQRINGMMRRITKTDVNMNIVEDDKLVFAEMGKTQKRIFNAIVVDAKQNVIELREALQAWRIQREMYLRFAKFRHEAFERGDDMNYRKYLARAKAYRDKMLAHERHKSEHVSNVFSRFKLMLLVSNDVHLLNESQAKHAPTYIKMIGDDDISCGKIKKLKSELRVIAKGDNRIIVFTQWERMQKLIVASLTGFKVFMINGGMSKKTQYNTLETFQKTDAGVLVATDCFSRGQNIQAANYVINIDFPFNPSVLAQRNARINRINSARKVNYINIVSRNAIETRTLEIIYAKLNLISNVLVGNDSMCMTPEKFGIAGVKKLIEEATPEPEDVVNIVKTGQEEKQNE